MNPPQYLVDEVARLHTFNNPQYLMARKHSPTGYTNIEKYVELYSKSDDSIQFPRGFPLDRLSSRSRKYLDAAKIVDMRCENAVSWPDMTLEPNKEQKALLSAFTQAISGSKCPFGNYLLQGSTSMGKTIALLMIARATKQKTLVLYHRNTIKKSWTDDLKFALGLGSKEVGVIQGEKFKIGEVITLASIRTLFRRQERWDELFSEMGCIILDEADIMGSNEVNRIVYAAPSRYLIGTSATNKNARTFFATAAFGLPIVKVDTAGKDTSTSLTLRKVKVHYTAFEYEGVEGMVDFNDLLLNLILDEDRNQLIVDNVYEQWKRGERPMIVTKRIAHLRLLLEMLKDKGVTDATAVTAEGMTPKQIETIINEVREGSIRCIIAIEAIVLRGVNLNPMENLHIATPIAKKDNLQQLIGRMRRKAKGKTHNQVDYYFDKKVAYLTNLYKRVACPTFAKEGIEKYKHMF